MTRSVALYSTCLVNAFRPSVARASRWLLETAGFQVVITKGQTCCGQPAYNAGDLNTTRKLATRVILSLSGFDYVVVPSGSCADMLINQYPRLFAEETLEHQQATAVANKTRELVSFLVEFGDEHALRDKLTLPANEAFSGAITYHDSCTGHHSLGIREQARRLLSYLQQVELHEMEDSARCCGFGGTFCVKYDAISDRMASHKLDKAKSTGAQAVVGGDLGCLLHLGGKLSRQQQAAKTLHIAEVLAAGRCADVNL